MQFPDYISRQVQRTTWNLLIIHGGVLVASVLTALFSYRYLHNAFNGPFPVDEVFLNSVNSLSEQTKRFLTVAGHETFETGFQYVSTSESRAGQKPREHEIESDYVILATGERLLLVKADHGSHHARTFTGSLVPIPQELYQGLVMEAEATQPGIKDAFYPFMFDAGEYRAGAIIGLLVGIPLFLFSLWSFIQGSFRLKSPEDHPIIRMLGIYGDPVQMATQVETELKGDVQKFGDRSGKVRITRSWLLNPTFLGLNLVRLDGLAWAYKKTTSHSVNFIPTHKSHALSFRPIVGRHFEVQLSEQAGDKIMEALAAAAPWTVLGYSEELMKLWKRDRRAFCEGVADRREKVLANDW